MLAWLAVGLWTGLILWLSTDSFSAQETSRIIGPLLDFFFPGLEPAARAAVHAAIRKSAHVFEYAVLALLVWRACLLGTRAHGLRAATVTLALVAAVAMLDETGQGRRAARTGSARDVALDVAGGAAAVVAAAAWRRHARGRRAPSPAPDRERRRGV